MRGEEDAEGVENSFGPARDWPVATSAFGRTMLPSKSGPCRGVARAADTNLFWGGRTQAPDARLDAGASVRGSPIISESRRSRTMSPHNGQRAQTPGLRKWMAPWPMGEVAAGVGPNGTAVNFDPWPVPH